MYDHIFFTLCTAKICIQGMRFYTELRPHTLNVTFA